MQVLHNGELFPKDQPLPTATSVAEVVKPVITKCVNAHDELVAKLEEAREFIMRHDESDDGEVAMSKEISDLLAKLEAE